MDKNKFGKQGWTPQQIKNLNEKTYLITGANAGAGFEATKILLGKGATVVMLNRSESKSNTAIKNLKALFGANAKVSFIKMDLASLSSVRNAANKVNKSTPKIDALICNAAVAQIAKQEFTTDGFESQLGINHYGHFLLINLLFDTIENSNGRIVVVGSEGYKMGLKTIQFDDMNFDKNYHPNNTYCHSKLAQMMFAFELQQRIKASNKNTKVYVCHPGASKTSLIKKDAPLMTRFMWSILSNLPIVQSAEKGAYPEIMCATENNLKQEAYYGPTGRSNWVGPVGECEMEPFVINRTVASKLWTVSEEKTGESFQL
ncbi:SDR family oxidoreductase [Lacinutrix sp. 5H-3-7-4]|uniref:SDR family oxidoreductase n=1 Tax=Lacinutrix sp. (strain 5H-3-7-4) TaxID=983544 RepID=UPI00020A338A|nr:SDR family oxidoreductase [Lacinutrix sp. 5H-3-7-4]AEH02563.1 short-chain dehydrogenase/reductase SDR [Lacinutrix sp. 5H-3-7-4]